MRPNRREIQLRKNYATACNGLEFALKWLREGDIPSAKRMLERTLLHLALQEKPHDPPLGPARKTAPPS